MRKNYLLLAAAMLFTFAGSVSAALAADGGEYITNNLASPVVTQPVTIVPLPEPNLCEGPACQPPMPAQPQFGMEPHSAPSFLPGENKTPTPKISGQPHQPRFQNGGHPNHAQPAHGDHHPDHSVGRGHAHSHGFGNGKGQGPSSHMSHHAHHGNHGMHGHHNHGNHGGHNHNGGGNNQLS